VLTWSTLERIYPRYPNIQDIRIMDQDRSCIIDLRPFMNTAPYVINETASVSRYAAGGATRRRRPLSLHGLA
jgi:chloride channel 7